MSVQPMGSHSLGEELLEGGVNFLFLLHFTNINIHGA